VSGPTPTPNDRTGDARVGKRVPVLTLVGLSISAAWAFWPIETPAIPGEVQITAGQENKGTLAALDVEAFRAPLWLVAAPPPPPPPAPPPPQPLKLQLLAILNEGGVYKAAIYDPDSDKLFVAATGESAAGRKIERIGTNSIDLRDGDRMSTLALVQGEQR
jgi:hypothetical protein